MNKKPNFENFAMRIISCIFWVGVCIASTRKNWNKLRQFAGFFPQNLIESQLSKFNRKLLSFDLQTNFPYTFIDSDKFVPFVLEMQINERSTYNEATLWSSLKF